MSRTKNWILSSPFSPIDFSSSATHLAILSKVQAYMFKEWRLGTFGLKICNMLFVFIPCFDEISVHEAEEGGVDTNYLQWWCSCGHWIVFIAAKDVSSWDSSQNFNAWSHWTQHDPGKRDDYLQNWKFFSVKTQTLTKLEGLLVRSVYLNEKRSSSLIISPPQKDQSLLIRTTHRRMLQYKQGSPSCQLSICCKLHLCRWDSEELKW